jgi:hypothetical protein
MVWQPWLFSTPTRDVRCLRGAGHGVGWLVQWDGWVVKFFL